MPLAASVTKDPRVSAGEPWWATLPTHFIDTAAPTKRRPVRNKPIEGLAKTAVRIPANRGARAKLAWIVAVISEFARGRSFFLTMLGSRAYRAPSNMVDMVPITKARARIVPTSRVSADAVAER